MIHQQGDRWIAYVGHHGGKPKLNPLTGTMEHNGTSIVDVTDPAEPEVPRAHPGRGRRGRSRAARRWCGCATAATLPKGDRNKVYLLRTFGNSAHEIWDVTAPEKPAMVTTVVKGLRDTHKSWWECDTGIAYLVSGVKGWRTRRMTQVYDLSDPGEAGAHPRLRPARPGARREGAEGQLDDAARPDLDRAEGQPHLLRLRHRCATACCRSSTARSC